MNADDAFLMRNVVVWFSSNELLLNFTKTDDLHFGPHHKKFYIKDEHDMTELHGIIPNFILNEPWDTLEDLEKGINTT